MEESIRSDLKMNFCEHEASMGDEHEGEKHKVKESISQNHMSHNCLCFDTVVDSEIGDPGQYSPLVLAYMGDSVYETLIRDMLVRRGNKQVKKLFREATHFVKASAQASIMKAIEPMLTEKEHAIYKRGRNAHSTTMAKNATVSDYRNATGFEALIGWLWLSGQKDRIVELVGDAIRERCDTTEF